MLGFSPLAVGPLGWIPSSAPPSAEVTGSAAVTMGGFVLSASASASMTASAAAALQALGLSAGTSFTISGTGSATMEPMTLASAGTMAIGAASAGAVGSIALESAGGFTITGSGAAQMAGFGLSALASDGSAPVVVVPRIIFTARPKQLTFAGRAKQLLFSAKAKRLTYVAKGNGMSEVIRIEDDKLPIEVLPLAFDLSDWDAQLGTITGHNVEVESGSVTVPSHEIDGTTISFSVAGGQRMEAYSVIVSVEGSNGLFANRLVGMVI